MWLLPLGMTMSSCECMQAIEKSAEGIHAGNALSQALLGVAMNALTIACPWHFRAAVMARVIPRSYRSTLLALFWSVSSEVSGKNSSSFLGALLCCIVVESTWLLGGKKPNTQTNKNNNKNHCTRGMYMWWTCACETETGGCIYCDVCILEKFYFKKSHSHSQIHLQAFISLVEGISVL